MNTSARFVIRPIATKVPSAIDTTSAGVQALFKAKPSPRGPRGGTRGRPQGSRGKRSVCLEEGHTKRKHSSFDILRSLSDEKFQKLVEAVQAEQLRRASLNTLDSESKSA